MRAKVHGDSRKNRINDWTIMFYLASDNELAPLIVSQLKSIKDAGYQRNCEVLVHFDPKEKGAQTRVYNVNSARKRVKTGKKKTHIGDSTSFIRNLLEDDIRELAPAGSVAAKNSKAASVGTMPAKDTLSTFLAYCAENHPAKHYMLFLVGHGMIVANDAFLPDQQPVSAITLTQLGERLYNFTLNSGGTLELLAMHSCSMSGIEVAYQLKGTASYMMASEGPSLVNSWPYRQLMMRTFKAIETGNAQSNADIGILIEKLYGLSFYNARDFWVSGYSLDLSLCSLDPKRVDGLTEYLQQLVVNLKKGLDDKRTTELILLAHLQSQSYWGESYTDLYDFCSCLSDKCGSSSPQAEIKTVCEAIKQKLKPVDSKSALERLKGLVVHSRHYGSKYQYSHGLSVYFPWAEPIDDKTILRKYKKYAFTQDLGEQSWLSFLRKYFKNTKRAREENGTADRAKATVDPTIDVTPNKAAVAAAAGIGVGATIPRGLGTLSDGGTDKTSGSTGADCTCPTIKNYPNDEP